MALGVIFRFLGGILVLFLFWGSRSGLLVELARVIREMCERRREVLFVNNRGLVWVGLGALGSTRLLGLCLTIW